MIGNIPTPATSVNELENTREIYSPESDCIDVVNEDLNTSEKFHETTMGMDSSYEQLPAKKKKLINMMQLVICLVSKDKNYIILVK